MTIYILILKEEAYQTKPYAGCFSCLFFVNLVLAGNHKQIC